MKLIETNASDKRRKEHLSSFKRLLQTKSLVRTLYLFDEIDGMQKNNQEKLSRILKNSFSSVIMTANEGFKIDLSLKKVCRPIDVKINQKHLRQIVDRMKKIAKEEKVQNPNFDKITFDIRSSINGVCENSEGYKEEKNSFEKIKEIIKEGKVEKIKSINGHDETVPWILDNIPNFYKGIDIYKAIKTIEIYMTTRNDKILSCLPPSDRGKAEYPEYLRKRSNHAKHTKGIPRGR